MPLLIDYDSSLVPDGGCHVYASIEVVKQVNKEAAGHIFHERALLQAGFIGECSPFKPIMATCFRAIHSSDGLLHSAAVVGRLRGGNSLTQTMIHWSLVPLPRLPPINRSRVHAGHRRLGPRLWHASCHAL